MVSEGAQTTASTGYIDLDLTQVYDPNYGGLLIVMNRDVNDSTYHTLTIYAIRLIGTIVTTSSLYTVNGASGGAAFTVTSPSNGVIRVTNNYASTGSTSSVFVGLNMR